MPSIVKSVWSAIRNLNPDEVRQRAEQNIQIGLFAASEAGFEDMEGFLCPPDLSRDRRLEALERLHRAGSAGAPARYDIELYGEGMRRPHGAFLFHAEDPSRTVRAILNVREDLSLTLARYFPPFRKPVIDKIIHTVSKENALFSLATALPDVMPNILELPWAVGQFASDTAFLTANQVRMAFLIAAASDQEIGYGEQKGEMGSIMAGAFGWRAVARQLVGKIPFGGGLLPKAAIAYAGTYVAGRVLEKVYRDGYSFTREERQHAYESGYERGKRVAAELLDGIKLKKS